MSRLANVMILIVSGSVLAYACGEKQSDPTFTDVQVTRNADHKGYTVTGTLNLPARSGYYDTGISARFGDGCRLVDETVDITYVPDSTAQTKAVSYQLKTEREIAVAKIAVGYTDDPNRKIFAEFNKVLVVDPSLKPPRQPPKECSAPVRDEPAHGRRSKTNEDAADAVAIRNMSRNEIIATAINTAGFLCARIVDTYPDSAGQIIAHCIKYRSGRGRAKYRIDADGGTVEDIS